MASNKLGKFKTYRQEYFRDKRRGNKYRGQIEARLESDRTGDSISLEDNRIDMAVSSNQ